MADTRRHPLGIIEGHHESKFLGLIAAVAGHRLFDGESAGGPFGVVVDSDKVGPFALFSVKGSDDRPVCRCHHETVARTLRGIAIRGRRFLENIFAVGNNLEPEGAIGAGGPSAEKRSILCQDGELGTGEIFARLILLGNQNPAVLFHAGQAVCFGNNVSCTCLFLHFYSAPERNRIANRSRLTGNIGKIAESIALTVVGDHKDEFPRLRIVEQVYVHRQLNLVSLGIAAVAVQVQLAGSDIST